MTTALELHDVSLRFGGVIVLQGVDLRVEQGETLGIVGPNGAGKTSLLNCVSRVYRAQSGTIEVEGQPVQRLRPEQVAALGVARTFQSVEVFRDMTALDVVLLGRHTGTPTMPLRCALGLPAWRRTERAQRRTCLEALDFVGLASVAGDRIGELPYGAVKRIDLARALAAQPRLLLLDEPASGLDRTGRQEMIDLLCSVRSRLGVTTIVIEHDMALVNAVCDRLLVLDAGRVIATGPPAEVIADPIVREAFLGPVDRNYA